MSLRTHKEMKKRIDSFLAEIHELQGEAHDTPLDALDAEGTRKLVDSLVKERGKIDILVLNVGKNSERLVENMTDEGWQRFIDLNLSSAYYGIRAVIPHMLRQSYGRIILIGSSAAYDGGGGAIDYAAAKAGMRGMMLYLCKTYTRKGINTNIVHPCVIGTDLVPGSGTPQKKNGRSLNLRYLWGVWEHLRILGVSLHSSQAPGVTT